MYGRVLIPDKGKIFLYSIASNPVSWAQVSPYKMGTGALSLWVNRLGREADQSPPSSAEVKNVGAVLPFTHMSSWHSA
jgi:hypothetical protein